MRVEIAAAMNRASRWVAGSLLLPCWLGIAGGAPASAAPAPTLDASPELAAEVGRMAKVGSCFSPAFSPDGLQIAFVSNLSGLPQVWTVAADGGWPRQVTALDDQVGGVAWSPDGRWLAFTVAPGGGLNTQVYLARPDGREVRRGTDGGKGNNQPHRRGHDGRPPLLGSHPPPPPAIAPHSLQGAGGRPRKSPS